MVNYYDILGLPRTATREQIKNAYRAQIKFFHPDIFDGSPEIARIKTLQLNEAYAVLYNPERRREYDYQLQYEEAQAAREAQAQKEKARKEQAEREQRQREEEAHRRAAEKEEEEERQRQAEEAERQERMRREQADAWHHKQEQEPQNTAEQVQDPPQNEDFSSTNKEPFSTDEEQGASKTGHRFSKHLWKIVSAICVAAVCLMAWQVGQYHSIQQVLSAENEELHTKLLDSQAEGGDLQKTVSDNAIEIETLNSALEKEQGFSQFMVEAFNFYYDNVGLANVGESTYYHNFFCEDFDYTRSFVAHNSLYCEHLGLEPCPKCWEK